MRSGLKLLLAALLFVSSPSSVIAAPYESYQYDYYGYAVATPAPYLPETALTGNDLGVGPFNQPNDLHVASNGHIFVSDTGNNRIIELDENWSTVRVLDRFDGDDVFQQPQGIAVGENGNIYVADTENRRVVVLTSEGEYVRSVENPASDILPPDFVFYPQKLTVDYADRVYVIARGMFEGIMQFDVDGEFLGFVGTNKVTPNVADYLWKLVATQEQRQRMVLFVPSEFSNVDIDDRGFVYATNVDMSTNDPIKRLNPSGDDVLKRHGYHFVKGDIQYDRIGQHRGPSRLVDIAVRGDGIYSALDAHRGRIFTYDDEGNLLYVFGGIGGQLGNFRTPVALDSAGHRLAVLDRGHNRIVLFEPTAYGTAVNQAASLQYNGKDEEAVAYWQEALRLNVNFDVAYIGIGKALLMERRNREAMEYFRLGMSRTYYSTAFKRYRKEVLRENFGLIMNTLLLLSAAFITYRIQRKIRNRRRGARETAMD